MTDPKFAARLVVDDPQSVAEFTDPNRAWCPDCPATVTTVVVGRVGIVDVVHAATCPTLAKRAGGAR